MDGGGILPRKARLSREGRCSMFLLFRVAILAISFLDLLWWLRR